MTADPAEILRVLFERSPSALIVLNADGLATDINPAAERLFGLPRDALAGRDIQPIFADPQDYRRLQSTGFRDDRGTAALLRFRTQTGRIFKGNLSASPLASDMPDSRSTLLIIEDVSGEQALKAKLEASDLQLRAALASANEGAFSLNVVTGLGSMRGFITEFLGIGASDATISLDRWMETVRPEHQGALRAEIDATTRQPSRPLDTTYESRRADGEWRWLQMRGRVTEFGRDGQALRISGVISDVTERQQLELKLADRERQLASAIEAGSAGIWEVDPATLQVTPRGPIRAMLGLPEEPETIDGRLWLDRTHPDDRGDVERQLAELASGETDTVDSEYRLLDARNGNWIWLRSRGGLTEASDGSRIAAGILTDISDRKALEADLADNERVLREAIESANDTAWSINIERSRIRISGFLPHLLGYDRDTVDIPLREWGEHLPPEERARAFKAYNDLTGDDRASAREIMAQTSVEFPIIDRDGTLVWLRSRGRAVETGPDGKAIRLAGVMANITEEKRLGDELEESERRLREALIATNEGAWRLNIRTRISEVTAVIAEMMGLPPADARVTFDDWASRVDEADREAVFAHFRDLRDGRIDRLDMVFGYHSEKHGLIRIHNRGRIAERDADGRPLYASGFLNDITDRVDTQIRLEQREKQLMEAVSAASMAAWRIDLARQRMSMRGPAVLDLFGEGSEIEMPANEWLDHVHPDDIATLTGATRALRKDPGEISEAEYRVRKSDGSWSWHRAVGRVMETDDDDRPTVATGVIWNIDAARELDAVIERERAHFDAVYTSIPAMMHAIDSDRRIVAVSDYWLEQLGYEREEVIGRKSVEFLDEESRQIALESSLPALFETGRQLNTPYRFRRKDGSLMDVLLSSTLERDEEGNPYRAYAIMTDVTELRRTNVQLARSNEELDRFATVASHDLQEPLRKISAFASLVQRRYSDRLDEQGARSLEFLVDAAGRMQRLIDDLLTYSRLASQALKIEQTDTRLLLDDVLGQLDTAISESGAKIEARGLPVIPVDATLLRQILQNLVANAVKYRADTAPNITVSARRKGSLWRFSVRDDGIGLDTRFADKIFAPFQRLHTREEYSGTGIGLAIVRQAVERLGGHVWVESEPGKGACFRFTIPAGDRDAGAVDDRPAIAS